MKGVLALDVIVKWIILSVVALVVIGLVINFSGSIKRYLKDWFGKEGGKEAEIVESNEFTTFQVITYIRSCWDHTGEKFFEDTICYILKGDVSRVEPDRLEKALDPPAQVNVEKFDPDKTTTIIRFENIGNIIHVES